MKKLLKTLLVMVLSFVLFTGIGITNLSFTADGTLKTGETVAFAAETKYTTDALNLRTGPGLGYSILLTMPKGASVTVLGTSGDWSKVTYNGTTGYAYSIYLTSAVSSTKYATTSSVNLRTGPGTGYSIILTIPAGQIVSVYSISNNWARLTYNGNTGYSYASYLTKGTEYITTSSLNLRTGPGTGYSIILTMPQGKSVRVFSVSNNWGRLVYNDTVGYSSMSYLRLPSSSEPAPTPTPTPTPSPGTALKIYKGITAYSGKRIAITFDDGASSANVNKVLDILDNYNAKSTFFFTGEWILANPSLARAITARGHRMESHTVSHPYLTQLTDDQIRYQLNRSRQIIKDTVGQTAYLMRPPYGDTSDRVLRITGETGYKYMVMWSIDTDDYLSTTTASQVVSRAVAGAYNNAILLLHPSHDKVITALPGILSQLRDQGYVFTTVNAMVP